MALLEILIGVLVVMGVLTRPAAAIGLALNLVLFLTASWHTVPYFLGSDIVFVFAWLPFVLAGAEGQPTTAAAARPPRAPAACDGGRARVAFRMRRDFLTRRALLAQALGLAGVVTAAAAAARRSPEAPIRATAPRPRATAGPPASQVDLGPAAALAPGDSQAYTDPTHPASRRW